MTPLEQVRADVLECMWEAPQYLFFSPEVDPLIYYSHLFPAVAALILAVIVIASRHKSLSSVLFVIISLLFVVFAVLDLLLWAIIDSSWIMFYWSAIIYVELLIYTVTLYLILVFSYGEDISTKAKAALGVLLLPLLIFGPTNLNLSGFDYSNCWRLAVEGPLSYYLYAVEIVIVGWILSTLFLIRRKVKDEERIRMSRYLIVGSLLFLLALSSGNIFGTIFQGELGENSWIIAQYGLFGMPLFLGFVMYIIVRFHAVVS